MVKNPPAMWETWAHPGLRRYPGGENGYPLQYSGLENFMDCTVQGVAKSQTWLRDSHFRLVVRGVHSNKKKKRDTGPRKENNLLTLILSKIKRLSNLLKINNFRARSLKSCQSGISLGQHVTKQRSKTVMTDCVHWDTAHLGLTCRRWCKWWTPFRFKFAYLDPGRNAESCKLCYFHFASLRRMTTVNILQTVEKTWLH